MKKAFTLIELLIVIAILGILGVGILIALDPIEQTRRAQDSTVQQSAIEIKDALNRYYASKLYFPWCQSTSAAGTCTYLGASGCTADGTSNLGGAGTCGAYVLNDLITVGELKSNPPSTITNALNLVTSGAGLAFMITFQPVSRSFDSNLTYLYSDTVCAVPGTTATCPSTGNSCYYCLR